MGKAAARAGVNDQFREVPGRIELPSVLGEGGGGRRGPRNVPAHTGVAELERGQIGKSHLNNVVVVVFRLQEVRMGRRRASLDPPPSAIQPQRQPSTRLHQSGRVWSPLQDGRASGIRNADGKLTNWKDSRRLAQRATIQRGRVPRLRSTPPSASVPRLGRHLAWRHV
jgi:hypothetical protein